MVCWLKFLLLINSSVLFAGCCEPVEDEEYTCNCAIPIDLESGVSTVLSCGDSSLEVGWNIEEEHYFAALDGVIIREGVSFINLLQYTCQLNGTVMYEDVRLWNYPFLLAPEFSLNKTFHRTASLPEGTVCTLSGCYTWKSQFDERKFPLPRSTCTVTLPTTTSHPLSTTTLPSTISSTNDPTLSAQSVHITPTSIAPESFRQSHTTTLMKPSPSSTAVHVYSASSTVQVSPSPNVELRNAGKERTAVLMGAILSMFGGLILLGVVLTGVVICKGIKKAHEKAKIDRKYFNDLKHFDQFQPVDPFKIVTTVSVHSFHDLFTDDHVVDTHEDSVCADPIILIVEPVDNNSEKSLLPREMTGNQNEHSSDGISSSNLACTIGGDNSNFSVSFDMLSLQSMDEAVTMYGHGSLISRQDNEYVEDAAV